MKPQPNTITPMRITHCGAEAVEEPAQHRPQHRGLELVHRGRARELGLRPAAVVAQDGEVGAEGLQQQRALHELHQAAGADHGPAVEEALHGCARGYTATAPASAAGSLASCRARRFAAGYFLR